MEITKFLFDVWAWFTSFVGSFRDFEIVLGIGVGTILLIGVVKALF